MTQIQKVFLVLFLQKKNILDDFAFRPKLIAFCLRKIASR